MKRHILKTLLAAVALSGLGLAQAQDKTIKFATQNPKGHPLVMGMEKFKEIVEAKSGGKIKVNLFLGGALGSDQANVSAMQGGTLEMVSMNSGILASPAVWKASGHLENFTDPLVECKNCHNRFRADQVDLQKNCPTCGKKDWTDVKQFNTMFKTFVGPVEEDASVAYLRPETCQAIFVNFKNVCDSTRVRVPFGIAQMGKSFRNEITPRYFTFRSREFEQMEIEYFIAPSSDWATAHRDWIEGCLSWFASIEFLLNKFLQKC